MNYNNTPLKSKILKNRFLTGYLLFPVVTSLLLIISCASPRTLSKNINVLVASGNYEKAASIIEEAKYTHYKQKNALLYYMDIGFLQHISGNYEESNKSFKKAKQIAKNHFTKSISQESLTFLISDNMRPYYGESFERVLVNIFSALNYIYLGKESEALVEARQADFFLQKLKTDYGHKNTYLEDAFARYLMGMIYENQNEINNAFISYWKALDSYKKYSKYFGPHPPSLLISDALRLAKRLGLNDDVKSIKKQWGRHINDSQVTPLSRNEGEIVIIHYNGLSPRKIDHYFEISYGKGWAYVNSTKPRGEDKKKVEEAKAIARSIASSKMIRVAFPKYVSTPYRITRINAKIDSSNDSLFKGEVINNIGALAKLSLKDRINRIRAKAIARAVIKFTLVQKASKKVTEKKGTGLGLLTKAVLQTAAAATEHADKRCWQTLPDQIQMLRIPLSKGKHNISLSFSDMHGKVIETKEFTTLLLKPAKRVLLV